MKKSKTTKEISLPMKWNPGLSKFEPELPLRKSGKKFKLKISKLAFWIIIIIIISFLVNLLIAYIYY